MFEGVQVRVLLVIAVGGVIGSLGRFSIAALMDHSQITALAATFTVNVLGAFAIGFAYPWIHSRHGSALWQPFVITGVLGGFTTFSTLAADVVIHDGQAMLVAGYLALTLLIGLLAVPLGRRAFMLLRPGT
ncbi:MAG: CrcB family protein [Actinomycetota bacterium]|nr:CrcB family protein [Actinomycetota bacterium]